MVLTDTLPAGSIVRVDDADGRDRRLHLRSVGRHRHRDGQRQHRLGQLRHLHPGRLGALEPRCAGANFSDTASVSSTTTDPNTANNSATVTGMIVGAPADLAVTNTGSPGTVNEGDKIMYTVTVSNTNSCYPNSATSVVLTDTLGANLGYTSASTTYPGATFTVSGSVVTFNLGSIAYGVTATMTVTAQAPRMAVSSTRLQ